MKVLAHETPDQKNYELPPEEKYQITIEKFPSSYRSQAVMNLQHVEWLAILRRAEMSSLIIPPPLRPVPFSIPTFGPDDPQEVVNLHPDTCRASFGSVSEVSYHAIPLVEKAVRDAQKSVNGIAFPWSKRPPSIRFH
jgi:hypothetical protein